MAKVGKVYTGSGWESLVGKSLASYQASAPANPQVGDIWIDSDDEVPGITSSLNYRWRRIATGGETSISGNDASGLPLSYNPGYEQLYLNGVLQYRGSDYVATTGNTITGLTALVANDTIEVLSFVTAPIGDTYTQAVTDAKILTGYRYLTTLYYTSTGTFTKASYSGLRAIRVKAVAGGGSGGGAGTTSAGEVSGSGGGGGGAYAESFITDIAGLASSITVTVGSGAVAVTGNTNGNTGGSSSFGTAVVCAGGSGGTNGGSRAPAAQFGDGGAGGVASAGDFTITGSGGSPFFAQGLDRAYPGAGGRSFLSNSPQVSVNATTGPTGLLYGGGGGGASNISSQAVNRTSGAGANGIVIVEVYA